MIARTLLALFFLPLFGSAADEPQPASPEADNPQKLRELIDTLDHGSLQEAFRLLTSDYIGQDRLDPLEVNRGALQGMLSRLDFGAMLLTEQTRSARNSPFTFYRSKITDEAAYIRFGRYNKSGLAQLDEALAEFSGEKSIATLIVDLRSPQAQAEFSIAAQILSRFRPPNELLFKIRRPDSDRPSLFLSKSVDVGWQRDLILLVDHDTGNVGEIIAAVLERETDCLVIGETTPGLTVEYRDVPIGEDRILRYAIAEVVLEDESSIYRTGITPDLITVTERREKTKIFRETQNGEAMADYLFPRQRPRMNEAALVAGTDPEIDYFLLLSNEEPTPWDTKPPLDRVLRQAVDLLTTTAYLKDIEK